MQVKLDTFLQHIGVPRSVTRFTTQNELDGWIEEFQRLSPLISFLGVVLLGHLFDLPGTPDFVAKSPVLDLRAAN